LYSGSLNAVAQSETSNSFDPRLDFVDTRRAQMLPLVTKPILRKLCQSWLVRLPLVLAPVAVNPNAHVSHPENVTLNPKRLAAMLAKVSVMQPHSPFSRVNVSLATMRTVDNGIVENPRSSDYLIQTRGRAFFFLFHFHSGFRPSGVHTSLSATCCTE
jgi:hypothetical protein